MSRLILLSWGLLMMAANVSQATEMMVRVNDIDVKRGGNIVVMVFGRDGFPIKHEKALSTKSAKATHSVLEFQFNVELEEIAVKVHHDEDESGAVTKNWTGFIPAEGLGFSKDQTIGVLGPPSYQESKLTKQQYMCGVDITVHYP